MKASSMKYLVGEGARNVGANHFMSLASIGITLIGLPVYLAVKKNAK